jgi:hypothetical protein
LTEIYYYVLRYRHWCLRHWCRYYWPQIPILKLPHFPANSSLLMRELRPLATYFGGSIDAPLSDQEFGEVLDSGYIGVVSNTPETFSPSGQARPRFLNTTCKFIARSLANQAKLYRLYGKGRTRCAAPDLSAPACTGATTSAAADGSVGAANLRLKADDGDHDSLDRAPPGRNICPHRSASFPDDGDSPDCKAPCLLPAPAAVFGGSIYSMIPLAQPPQPDSALKAWRTNMAKAGAIMRQHGHVLSTESGPELHVTLQYFCCQSHHDGQAIQRIYRDMEWPSLNVTFDRAVCRVDYDDAPSGLFLPPSSSATCHA